MKTITDWQAEYDALPAETRARVRNCALIFKVPLMHAFLRAKSLGLLNEPSATPRPLDGVRDAGE